MTIDIKDMYKYCVFHKVRFPSCVGELTVEQVCDLPLKAPDVKGRPERADLDKVAKAVSSELKSITEESFVTTSSNPRVEPLTVALEVVKDIIAHKQAEEKAKAEKAANAELKATLLEAYQAKKQEELVTGKSSEELLAAIKALG